MKRLFYLPVFLCLLVSAIGCGNSKDKMIAINNKIAKTNDTLFMKGKAWGSEIGTAWSSKDFSHVAALHTDVLGFIDRKAEEIKKMDNAGGSEKLKDAELAFLEYEKSILAPASVFNSFNATTSEETFVTAYQQLLISAQGEKEKLLEIQQIQKEFAEKNKIPLIEPKQ